MADQIILSWSIDVTGSSLGVLGAAAKLGAVPLYANTQTDPVLGQLFGLTVASDTTSTSGSVATRTLTLNMSPAAFAPQPFPCHPRTVSPPVLPYPLRRTRTLPGSFFVTNGIFGVQTSETQFPSINPGDRIQFLSQQGVFYTVASVFSATQIVLSSAYTGTSGNTGAFKEVVAPVTRAAMFSTSPLDTSGIVPFIPAGPGARTVLLTYHDSTGGGPFNVAVLLTGKRPAAVALAGGSIDIAQIDGMQVLAAGSFGNSVGQITLVELAGALPTIPANATLGNSIGAGQGDRTFDAFTDAAQMLISKSLAYLPPSYFALSQQGASIGQLDGDFIVTTGSKDVPTTTDQTGALSGGSTIQFAVQRDTFYQVASVTPKIVTLTTAFTGIDTNNTGLDNTGTNNNAGTRGNIGTQLTKKATGAMTLSSSEPTLDALSGPLGQFVAPETAAPPPNPPLPPGTVPAPTFLSGLFTRTLSLALAAPVAARPIAFA